MSVDNFGRGERTRTEITRSAYRLFLERGFHGTSMREIAKVAGIAVGGIYNHFKSKEDIFMAVLIDYHPIREVLPALRAAQGETVEGFVRDAAMKMVSTIGKRKDFLNLVFIEMVEFKGQHFPQLFGITFPQLLEFTQRFVEGRDELRPIPLPILLRSYLGLFFSYVITEILMGKQHTPNLQEEALSYFVDIFLHGILMKDDSGPVRVTGSVVSKE